MNLTPRPSLSPARSGPATRFRAWPLLLLLLAGPWACGPREGDKRSAPPSAPGASPASSASRGPRASRQALRAPPPPAPGPGFGRATEFSELSGLPPRPAASDLTVGALRELLGTSFPELFGAFTEPKGKSGQAIERKGALERYADDTPVRLIETYSRDYPVFLAGELVAVPNADGVLATLPSPPSAESFDPAQACKPLGGTHTCEPLYQPGSEYRAYEVLVLIGWTVELARDVTTNGRTLVVVADAFRARGHTIDTHPTALDGPAPEQPADPERSRPAPSGRSGRPGGSVVLLAAEVDGIRVEAGGYPGEQGLKGVDTGCEETFDIHEGAVSQCKTCTAKLTGGCLPGDKRIEGQSGGAGGTGGAGGDVIVRYAVLRGLGARRGGALTEPVDDHACIGACDRPTCELTPSISVCDLRRESDNARCADGIDNDGDGKTDCEDEGCSGNPYVTVCPGRQIFREASPEACTDGVDNDGDGYVDCQDAGCQLRTVCGARPGGVFGVTTGWEEVSDIACSDGLDNDLDGAVDCADKECLYNPFVTVCGTERTIDRCTDGKDNDGDGKIDCQDPNCDANPYVKICHPQWYPFLRESTVATCSDGIDNDGDRFIDCKDYQCLNSPLASPACGPQENTYAACTDGKDNDGDGKIDCDDPTCFSSPFFGDVLCRHKLQTKHKQSADPGESYLGVYRDADLLVHAPGAPGGAGGAAGRPLGARVDLGFDWHPCEPEEEPCFTHCWTWCGIGHNTGPGGTGATGRDGFVSVRSAPRRGVDKLRSLLAPRQWSMATAQANALYKRGDKASLTAAGYLYLHDTLRMQGVLADEQLDCAVAQDFAALKLQRAVLLSALCPTAGRDTQRLSYLVAGRDYFGSPPRAPRNPRERYAAQHEALMANYDQLEAAVSDWINLANGIDASAVLIGGLQSAMDNAKLLKGEVEVYRARESAALEALRGLDDKLSSRQHELQKIKDKIETNNQAIKDKYNSGSGLGGLILDLASSFLGAVGGDLAKKAGDMLGSALWDNLKNQFGGESKPGVTGSKNDLLAKIWSEVKDSAVKGIKSDAVKDKAEKAVVHLGDLIAGTADTQAVRSVIVDEIANEILSASQTQIALDYLDLQLDQRKAQKDYQVAQMERQQAELRQLTAAASVDRLRHYLEQQAPLRAYDKMILLNQVYSDAIMLVEELTLRYWRLLRQAEYEYLPYNATGQSELYLTYSSNLDLNLVNYRQVGTAVRKLHEDMQARARGNRSALYRRTLGAQLQPATASDQARFAAIGLDQVPVLRAPTVLYVAHLRVGYADLDADPLLKLRRNVRIDDVRVSLLADKGGAPAQVFLVRDSLDAFRVRRAGGENFFADFDLVPRDAAPGGAPRAPLHYQSLMACSAKPPGCDLSKPACVTQFAGRSIDDYGCGLYGGSPGPAPWTQISFYDRSLVGEWFVVVPSTALGGLGAVRAIELSFAVSSLDL